MAAAGRQVAGPGVSGLVHGGAVPVEPGRFLQRESGRRGLDVVVAADGDATAVRVVVAAVSRSGH